MIFRLPGKEGLTPAGPARTASRTKNLIPRSRPTTVPAPPGRLSHSSACPELFRDRPADRPND
ncbi:hypothetical protein BO82DRAFT_349932 [Aspergillus uvarum CBS 121591]|uniref:Uncharacterized protein n=1 Tax=Aspergillus uvarum CBS 121591 TaxID=1448315 RepID=A0A319CWE9_9EURO|nr:hypothetical protein BO82DRAFT_349932 [Aspergillus uvarum CBS 121591]PYH86817.1 hypothetical protein BO82DRAFT_349932 [Aspergillus uvarum CBS 121591]